MFLTLLTTNYFYFHPYITFLNMLAVYNEQYVTRWYACIIEWFSFEGNQSSSNSSTGPSSPVSGMGSLVLSRLQEVATYIFQRQDSNQDEAPPS